MAISNVVITDGTTPLTFEPFTGQVGSQTPASWLEKSSGTFIGYKQLTLMLARSKGAKGALKSTVALKFPKLGTVDGMEVVIHNSLFNGSVTIPDTMTLSERTAFAAYIKAAIDAAVFKDAVIFQRVPV